MQTSAHPLCLVTTQSLAAALTEWDRRWREEPDRFMSEAQHLLKETPETYGEIAAPYLMSILQEQLNTGECTLDDHLPEGLLEKGCARRVCTECAHSAPASEWSGVTENEPECRHELAIFNRRLTTEKRSYLLALIMRASNGACGPDGRLWQPKPELDLGLEVLAQHAEGPGR